METSCSLARVNVNRFNSNLEIIGTVGLVLHVISGSNSVNS